MRDFYWWFALLFLIVGFGCGNGELAGFSNTGGSVPSQNGPQFRELGSTVAKSVDSAGGNLEAVLSDGTRFLLTIPAGALSGPVDFTFTPERSAGSLDCRCNFPWR